VHASLVRPLCTPGTHTRWHSGAASHHTVGVHLSFLSNHPRPAEALTISGARCKAEAHGCRAGAACTRPRTALHLSQAAARRTEDKCLMYGCLWCTRASCLHRKAIIAWQLRDAVSLTRDAGSQVSSPAVMLESQWHSTGHCHLSLLGCACCMPFECLW
jgi:hypothetical protein